MNHQLNFAQSNDEALYGLKALYLADEHQEVFRRTLSTGLNGFQTIRVMKILKAANFGPRYGDLFWDQIEKCLSADTQEEDSNYILREGVLPGNNEAYNALVASDGNTIVCSTTAFVPLGVKVAAKNPGCFDADGDFLTLNIIDLTQKTEHSIRVPFGEDGTVPTFTCSLLSITAEQITLLDSAQGGFRSVWRIDRLASDPKPVLLDRIKAWGSAYCSGSDGSLWYVSAEGSHLEKFDCSTLERQSIAIEGSMGPEPIDIQSLTVSNDGTVLIVCPSHQSPDTPQLFGVADVATGEFTWVRKIAVPGMARPSACIAAAGGFILLDENGRIFSMDGNKQVHHWRETQTLLRDRHPVLSFGEASGLLLTYFPSAKKLRLWDSNTQSLILELAVPKTMEAFYWAYQDKLLISHSREPGKTRGALQVTFLDYLFICGKSPRELTESDRMKLRALIALAPNDPQLTVLDCLIDRFTKESSYES